MALLSDAKKYASTESGVFKNSLQFLLDQQNNQKVADEQSMSGRYQNLMTTINQQEAPINENYQADTKQAFITKLLAERKLDSNLNRLGLNTQGFGVTQQMLGETAYGQNVNNLKLDKRTALRELANKKINATGDYNVSLDELDASYTSKLGETNRYINERTADKESESYGRYMTNRQYENDLEQTALDNAYRNRPSSSGDSISGFDDTTIPTNSKFDTTGKYTGVATSVNPYVGQPNAVGKANAQTSKDRELGVFSGGYQPSYIYGKKLSKAKKGGITVGYVFGNGTEGLSGVNMDSQNIWMADGKYYAWDGSADKYVQLNTAAVKAKLK